jgi:nucleoside-diphosphate-sugar epimerase
MREVAAAVAAGIARETSVEIDASNIDHRNYRVATDKAEAALDFRARHSVEDGAARIMAALADGSLRNGPLTIRLNGYRRLVERMAS